MARGASALAWWWPSRWRSRSVPLLGVAAIGAAARRVPARPGRWAHLSWSASWPGVAVWRARPGGHRAGRATPRSCCWPGRWRACCSSCCGAGRRRRRGFLRYAGVCVGGLPGAVPGAVADLGAGDRRAVARLDPEVAADVGAAAGRRPARTCSWSCSTPCPPRRCSTARATSTPSCTPTSRRWPARRPGTATTPRSRPSPTTRCRPCSPGRYPDQPTSASGRGRRPENLFTLLGGSYDLHVREQVTRLCPAEAVPAARARRAGPPAGRRGRPVGGGRGQERGRRPTSTCQGSWPGASRRCRAVDRQRRAATGWPTRPRVPPRPPAAHTVADDR